MKIKQLSVFLENRPGQLSETCTTLAEANCNIVTLSLADTNQFGILRLIVFSLYPCSGENSGALYP